MERKRRKRVVGERKGIDQSLAERGGEGERCKRALYFRSD